MPCTMPTMLTTAHSARTSWVLNDLIMAARRQNDVDEDARVHPEAEHPAREKAVSGRSRSDEAGPRQEPFCGSILLYASQRNDRLNHRLNRGFTDWLNDQVARA